MLPFPSTRPQLHPPLGALVQSRASSPRAPRLNTLPSSSTRALLDTKQKRVAHPQEPAKIAHALKRVGLCPDSVLQSADKDDHHHHLHPDVVSTRFPANTTVDEPVPSVGASADKTQAASSLPVTTVDEADAYPDIRSVEGYVHSTESFSAVDGPGMRYLVFAQGCAFRCQFCSNPDTWAVKRGPVMTSKDVAAQLDRELPYLKMSGGGITCSGGEAMLQPEFVAACFQEAKARGLNTCLDTTGQGTKHRHWDAVLPHTDLVLFCIKHMDPDVYLELTGHRQENMLRFAEELDHQNVPTWIRYVLIPGVTDDKRNLRLLIDFLHKHTNVLGVELLPYHRLGVDKWALLGLSYPMEGQRRCTQEEVQEVIAMLSAEGISVLCDVPAR